MATIEWRNHLLPFLDEGSSHGTDKYTVVLLNHAFDSVLARPSNLDDRFTTFRNVWNNASVRMTVDGGSNYLYNLQNEHPDKQSYCDPHLITGDFDSIQSDVLEHFKQKPGVEVINTPDQDDTDFCKAIHVLMDKHKELKQPEVVYVFGCNSGRIDQFLSIMSGLYKFAHSPASSIPIILFIDLASAISFVLAKGEHVIPTNKHSKWCSLVPLAGPVKLSTTGFRWNLSEDSLEFGKFISTSNEFDGHSELVTVNIFDRPILFSFDYKL